MVRPVSTQRINLASSIDCSGCGACASACPKMCIQMREDKEGFLQPAIDKNKCIKCHKCEKVCPILNPETIDDRFETLPYAAINRDEEIRGKSSSGGVFYALAKWIIVQGGVVFGARFNENWEVVHSYAETLEGIIPFMGSKYVQSRIGVTFRQAKGFLEDGRWVLFSGTPCQLGGLRAFLGKEYDHLLQVDVICFGVPSPGVWQSYLKEIVKQSGKITSISFRDKGKGWKHYQCKIVTSNESCAQDEGLFLRGFLKEAYLRKSCHSCHFRFYHRNSDITIADYWGVDTYCHELFDDKGTSIVFVHSERGEMALRGLSDDLYCVPQSKVQAIANNPCMENKNPQGIDRSKFFRVYRLTSFRFAMSVIMDKKSIYNRLQRRIKRVISI